MSIIKIPKKHKRNIRRKEKIIILKDVKIDHCPYCGGEEFGEGRQMAQGNILPTKGFLKGTLGTGTSLYHTICLACGSSVRSYVKDTKKFE